jgi:hypothetical protein
MNTKKLILFAFISFFTTSLLKAQSTICDCKMENGKNMLVVSGTITLKKVQLFNSRPKRHTYFVKVNVYNKSACTLTMQNIKVSNSSFNPKVKIDAGGPESEVVKEITVLQPINIIELGQIKIVKTAVTYMLNNIRCSQVFELQYFDETLQQ